MAAKDLSPWVVISDDRASAELVIPAGCDRALLTEPLLLGLIRGEGVEPTSFTTEAIRNFLNSPPQPDAGDEQDIRFQVASAQPPVHGTPGRVQWFVDEKKVSDDKPKDEDAPVSFYERCAFVMVHRGDVIGKVHPAVPGEDGRDVTGATLTAREGKDAAVQADDTILRKMDGTLIAQQDGVLYRESGKAQIRKRIEIREYVDFSTGNIDFDGDISIGRGVRDCFLVKATGSVEVRGLIEAATIETGRDLVALGGFAGRERGHAVIGRHLLGRYLDNVYGHVKHDLSIDREVINCELIIDGDIRSPRGSIIGGKVSPTGTVEIGSLGSSAGVVTELVIGTVPALEPFARSLEGFVYTLTHERQKLTDEQDLINKLTNKTRMTATDRERQTELMFTLSTLNASLDKAQRTLDSVTAEVHKRRRVDVLVHQMVHPNVTLIFEGCRYKVYNDLKGPVRFYMEGRQFVYRQGEAPSQPVTSIADVSTLKPEKHAA